MIYDELINLARNNIIEFNEVYENKLADDTIDTESGVHTVFSLVFNPLLRFAIENKKDLAKKLFDFIELMETEGDKGVSEVVEFTILEEIIDDFEFKELEKYMGKETLKSYKLINRYIVNT